MPGLLLAGIHVLLRPDVYTAIAISSISTTVFAISPAH